MTVSDESFDILMDVSLQLTAEVGAATVKISDILQLGIGSVVELDRSIQQPIDLLVNGRIIARGEIVAVGDHYGLRVTELMQAAEA